MEKSESAECAKMMIEIAQCSDDLFWYKDLVGQTMAVSEVSVRDYYVMHGGRLRGILWKDAVIKEKSS